MMRDDAFYDEIPDSFQGIESSFPISVEIQSSNEFTGVTKQIDSNDNGNDKIKYIDVSRELQSLYYSTENDVLELKNLLTSWNLSELFEFFES